MKYLLTLDYRATGFISILSILELIVTLVSFGAANDGRLKEAASKLRLLRMISDPDIGASW